MKGARLTGTGAEGSAAGLSWGREGRIAADFPVAELKPPQIPRFDAATPMPPRSMVASKAVRSNGNRSAPQVRRTSRPKSRCRSLRRACPCRRRRAVVPPARSLRPAACASERPSPRRELLGHRIDAAGRGDQRGAIGRDEPALDRAPGLHQFGGEHDVDVAGTGISASTGSRPSLPLRKQLHVVDRGTRALGDAGHRGLLRDLARGLGQIDHPVGEHAAALAAHGEHRDADRTRCRVAPCRLFRGLRQRGGAFRTHPARQEADDALPDTAPEAIRPAAGCR